MTERSLSLFQSPMLAPLALLGVLGALAALGNWSHADPTPTPIPLEASANLDTHADDDPCPPQSSISAVGSSRDGGLAAAIQAQLCPAISVHMVSLEPKDPCPDPAPCTYPPDGKQDDVPGGSPGPVGWLANPAESFTTLRDGHPIEPDASSYGSEALRRSRNLDSLYVDARTGELTRIEQDLFLPGAGLDFALTRFYHSDLADYPSAYGAGWEISVHRRVIVTGSGGDPVVPETIQLVTGGGHPTGIYSDYSHDGRFEDMDRKDIFVYSATSPYGTFTHYLPDGLIETFAKKSDTEEWYYLVRSENPFGIATTFSYRDDNSNCPTEWCLESATDSVGRLIEFNYSDTTGLLDSVVVTVGSQTIAQVDYEYTDPGNGGPWLLSEVTGLEVATPDTQGSGSLMQRKVHSYGYWFDSTPGNYLLSSFTNSLGQKEHSWTFLANSGGQVLTQTDRADSSPLRAASVHTYAYPTGSTTYTGPEGEERAWILDGSGRIVTVKERTDPQSSAWVETNYTYDTVCSGCSKVSRVDFPDGRAIEMQYDEWGNPSAIWSYPANSSAPTRVERFLWSSFDPENDEPMTRLLQHEQVRDTVANEGPTANCNHPECGNQFSAAGWIMYEYLWSTNKKKLLGIDYGTIAKANWSGAPSMNRQEMFTYHADGRVATRTELEDSVETVITHFDLDQDGNFIETVTVEDPLNSQSWDTIFGRDALGWIVLTAHPDGTYTSTERDEGGRVWRVQEDYDPGAQTAERTTNLRYDREGRLIERKVSAGSLTDEVDFSLDETGQPIAVVTTGPGGSPKTNSIEISPSGLLLSVTDWRGVERGTEYGMGAWQLPIRRYEKLGTSERTVWEAGISTSESGYDEMGRLVGWRNAAGWPTAIVYDSLGRLQEVFTTTDATHVAGRHYNYDARGFVHEIEVGMTTGTVDNPSMSNLSWNEHHVFNHNLAGHLIAKAMYEGNASDPSRMQRFQVDLRGRREVVLTYQGNRASGLSAAVPIARDFAWDAMDRVVEEREFESWSSSAVAETTDYFFDDSSRELEVIITGAGDAYLERALAHRDALGRLETITEWEWTGSTWGQSRQFLREWDGLDRQTAAEDPLGKRWEWDYDDRHNLIEETIIPYDSSGNEVTSWDYDSTYGHLNGVTDAEGKETTYDYYTSGAAFLMPEKTTYADGRWEQVNQYDDLLRATELEDSRGMIRVLTYDHVYLTEDDSNLETLIGTDNHVAGPDEMRWTYDRLTGYPTASKLIQNGTEVWRTEFDYSKIGELESEIQGPLSDSSNPRFTWTWTWGFAGEMRSVGYPGGFGIGSGTPAWDTAGRMSGIEYVKSGTTLADYEFDYDGMRLAQRSEQVSGIDVDYSFDSWNRLTGMVWSKGSTVYDGQDRALDLGNRVIARKRSLDSTGEVFTHDGHHRMTKWWQGVSSPLSWNGQSDPSTWSIVERYTLNDVYARSQIQREVNGGSTTTTNYSTNDAHFYTAVGSESRSTHHGFINGDGTFYYRWDAWGRLTEVRDASSGVLRRAHLYDCEGRRVRTIEYGPSSTQERKTRFTFWGMGLAASYDTVGTSTQNVRTYGYAGGSDGEAFVKVEQASSANGVYELARDFQGSMLALIKRTSPSSISVVERYRYEPFGAVSIENGSGQSISSSGYGNERFFLGRVWDNKVGVYDVRARWYEPASGSFLAPDLLGFVDSFNSYQYGLAEPNSVFDVFGMQCSQMQAEVYREMFEQPDPPGPVDWGAIGRGIGGGFCNGVKCVGIYLVGEACDYVIIFSGYDPLSGDFVTWWEYGLALTSMGPGSANGARHAAGNAMEAVSDAGRHADDTVTVRHYTDDVGVQNINQDGHLRDGSYVTTPDQIPPGSTPTQVAAKLEVEPGKGNNYVDVEVKKGDIAIPESGSQTSGGAWQGQVKGNTPVNPSGWKRTGD